MKANLTHFPAIAAVLSAVVLTIPHAAAQTTVFTDNFDDRGTGPIAPWKRRPVS